MIVINKNFNFMCKHAEWAVVKHLAHLLLHKNFLYLCFRVWLMEAPASLYCLQTKRPFVSNRWRGCKFLFYFSCCLACAASGSTTKNLSILSINSERTILIIWISKIFWTPQNFETNDLQQFSEPSKILKNFLIIELYGTRRSLNSSLRNF